MSWLRQLFSRRQLYQDLSEEIQEHLGKPALQAAIARNSG
jgi:hypothetical protein